ncbi:hypothetical protein N781_09035 [Pontibacillus halophilus JSM 076056 = DSM 19796]|uniref:DUF6792 domain-containing protein n=1 Tax=Pontibacillus halophilus JSM 076056 = DSM 19796 TaxID=1385510 RepID=A0A0A5I1W7_9BACI|nr:DUF6792 domain-containing protein [Pontibacillus halophilus]KGX89852.1 hypothetical protein N781_09035 [Pontibacillus halophilus JSM 076056 = DSM 19796]
MLLNSDKIRLRLLSEEYKELSAKEMEESIRLIYIEETGERFTGEIHIHKKEDASTGYNGTAVHFKSEEESVDELYIISQGTQDQVDWKYNIKSMLAGISYSQSTSTLQFVKEVKQNMNLPSDVSVIGLSHSLAHNNNVAAHLRGDVFDAIYSINGAQINYYQMFHADEKFSEEVINHFGVKNEEEIYEVEPEKLKRFAEQHYEDKSDHIHQLISTDDPLYGVSGVRGFFNLGETHFVDTNSEVNGLRSIMDGVPDEVVKDLQSLAIQYTEASERGGQDAVLKEILGVDMSVLVQKDVWGYGNAYISGELEPAIREANEKIGPLLEQVKNVTSNSDIITTRLVEAGYITEEEKKIIVEEMGVIEESLVESKKRLDLYSSMSEQTTPVLGDGAWLLDTKGRIEKELEKIEESGHKLDPILSKLGEEIVSSHGIPEMLKALSSGDTTYEGTDMVMSTIVGGKSIQINLTAAMRMYEDGRNKLQEKSELINRLELSAQRLVHDDYHNEKLRVLREIADLEQNPSYHAYLLGRHASGYYGGNKRLQSIEVHEDLPRLHQIDLSDAFLKLHKSVQEGYDALEKYRKSVEQLFSEEEKVSKLFDLVGSYANN